MSLFLLIVIFFLGACAGSFSAVILEKQGVKRSFWTGRSQCLSCKKTLNWYELIPLVSYALQGGKCRGCDAKIPRWIWYTEWYMAFLWMIAAMLLSYAGFTPLSTIYHILILTGVSLVVIEDIRLQTISDTKTIPLIGIIVSIFIWSHYSDDKVLFSHYTSLIILGGFIGMMFYMIQMILPALIETVRRHDRMSHIFDIFISPFIFPLWMVAKVLFGEKKADAWFPSLAVYEDMPTWVGGGDIRLGLIIGLLVGPYDFLFVILYGYVLGTVYFLARWIFLGKRMQTMPVAPLLFFGMCVVWCLKIFA